MLSVVVWIALVAWLFLVAWSLAVVRAAGGSEDAAQSRPADRIAPLLAGERKRRLLGTLGRERRLQCLGTRVFAKDVIVTETL